MDGEPIDDDEEVESEDDYGEGDKGDEPEPESEGEPDAEPKSASELVQDPKLVEEANRIGFTYDERRVWFAASPRQRPLIKGRKHKELKAIARANGLNPERFLGLTPDERDAAVFEAQTQLAKKRKDVFEKHLAKPETGELPSPEEPLKVYTAAADVPATDTNPQRRGGVTVGPIMERVDDLYGERPPRTLADIYARWPLFGRPGGDEFYLRVERIHPKQFNGIYCAGYIGDICGTVINEDQFGRFFGGREYLVQLYGPDPKGRCDGNGDTRIKALTDPIQVTVAHLNPNLRYLPKKKAQPAMSQQQPQAQADPFGPFQAAFAGGGNGVPVTMADASIVKTSLDFVRETMDKKPKQEDNTGAPPQHMMQYLSKREELQAQQAQREAEARDRLARDQIEQARKETERSLAALEAVKKEMAELKGTQGGSSAQVTEKIIQSKDDESRRIHDGYRMEITTLGESHKNHINMMNERHAGELTRAEERIKSLEASHREQLKAERDLRIESERHLKSERDDLEKRLRAEIDRIRAEERADAEKRLSDAKVRSDERMADIKNAQERELRTERSNTEVKVSTEVAKMTYELNHVRERLDEKEKQIEELKSELEDKKDPSAVMAQWESEAKKLGFKKGKDGDDEPKTFWQQLGASAGQGIGQSLAGMDIPALVGALTGAAAARAQARPMGQQRQMPGGQHPAQLPATGGQQQRGGVPSGRATRWASAGVPVAPPQPPMVPAARPVQQQVAPAAPPQPQPVQAAPPPVDQAVPPAPAAPDAGGQPPQQAQNPGLPPHRLVEAFGPEAIMGFLQSVEGAINSAIKPDHFAQLFFTQYKDPAAMLVAQFGPKDAQEFIGAMAERFPDALGSPILTKAGADWLEKMWAHLRTVSSGAPAAQPSVPQA
jgi:hypothetical protein